LYYTQTVTFTGGYFIDNNTRIYILINNNDSKFIKYQSIPSSITGICTMDALVNNFTISKCGIASLQGYTSNQFIPNNYLNFYYDSANSKLELWH
jgi:hypothetical protein